MEEQKITHELLKACCIQGDTEVLKLVMKTIEIDEKYLNIGEGTLRTILISTLMRMEESLVE